MKVHELIAALEHQDPNAEVLAPSSYFGYHPLGGLRTITVQAVIEVDSGEHPRFWGAFHEAEDIEPWTVDEESRLDYLTTRGEPFTGVLIEWGYDDD